MRYVGDEKKRLEFAQLHRNDDTKKIIFSDEHYSGANDSSCSWEWCREGALPRHRGRMQFEKKIHVWGAIGVGVKRLVLLPRGSTVNSAVYLKQCIQPNLDAIRGKTLMQDGAKAHTSAATTAQLKTWGVVTLDGWPARSPDLNPIEQLWSFLKRGVSDRMPTDEEELEAAIKAAWDAIPQSYIDNLVESFTRKLARCIADGGRTLR